MTIINETPVLATGNCLLIGCEITDTSEWLPGVLPLTASPQARELSNGHIPAVMGHEARATSLSHLTATLLHPRLDTDAGNSVPPSFSHHHLPARADMTVAGGTLRVLGHELVHAEAPSGSETLSVVITHVMPIVSWDELAPALTEHVREQDGRSKLVASLELPGIRYTTSTDTADSWGLVYPLLTCLDLSTEAKARGDHDVLLARELATTTTSVSHGSDADPNVRVTRARADLLTLSDDLVAQVTGRGLVLMSPHQGNEYWPAQAYASTIYADLVASLILTELTIHEMSIVLRDQIQLPDGPDVATAMHLRRRLLWLTNGLLRMPLTETRIQRKLLTRLHAERAVAEDTDRVTDDLNALLQVTALQHQVEDAAGRAAARQRAELEDQRAQEQAARDRRLDVGIAVLALIGLPVSVADSLLSNYHNNQWHGLIILFVTLVASVLAMVWMRRNRA